MLSNFFKSVYFNMTLAVLAAFFAIFQEVAIGSLLTFLSAFFFGSLVGVGFSWIAEAIKSICLEDTPYLWKNVIYGGLVGILASLIFAIVML